MMKTSRKFNSLEEMNMFLQDGKTVYSIANCGSIWFIEYNESNTINDSNKNVKTTNITFEDVVAELYEKNIIRKYGISDTYIVINNELLFKATASKLSDAELEMMIPLMYSYNDKNCVKHIIECRNK